MLQKLKEGEIDRIKTPFRISKEGVSTTVREQEIYGHLATLFDMSTILENDICKKIMMNMAISPAPIYKEWLYRDILQVEEGNIDYRDINELINLRWLCYDDSKDIVSIHPLIAQIAADKLKPNSNTCKRLMDNIFREVGKHLKVINTIPYTELAEDTAALSLTFKRIVSQEENDQLSVARLTNILAILNDSLAHYDIALEYWHESITLFEKELGEGHCDMATMYRSMGQNYKYQGKLNEAMNSYKKALSIRKKAIGNNHLSLCECYQGIAQIYMLRGCYTWALRVYKKNLKIIKWSQKDDDDLLASTWNDVAVVYGDLGQNMKSIQLHLKAIELKNKAGVFLLN